MVELQRLGGIKSVLKLLDSKKEGLRETAALVLSNATFTHTTLCKELVSSDVGTLEALVRAFGPLTILTLSLLMLPVLLRIVQLSQN